MSVIPGKLVLMICAGKIGRLLLAPAAVGLVTVGEEEGGTAAHVSAIA